MKSDQHPGSGVDKREQVDSELAYVISACATFCLYFRRAGSRSSPLCCFSNSRLHVVETSRKLVNDDQVLMRKPVTVVDLAVAAISSANFFMDRFGNCFGTKNKNSANTT